MSVLICQGKDFEFYFVGSEEPWKNSEHEGEVISSVIWKGEHGGMNRWREASSVASGWKMRRA